MEMEWVFEERGRILGYNTICGVDEAGRGPLAGDVYAAAVILPYGCEIPGVNDSKKLTEKRRDELTKDPHLTHERTHEYASYIMEAMETDKTDLDGEIIGTGMGMWIIGKTVVEYNGNVDLSENVRSENGFHARITLKGRRISSND